MFDRRRHRANLDHQFYYDPYAFMNPTMMGMYLQNQMRQQPFPMYPSKPGNWNPYFQSYPAFEPQYGNYPYPPMQNPYPTPNNNMPQNSPQMNQNSYAQGIFQNPLEPEPTQSYDKSQQQYPPNSLMNPYPKQSFIPKQPSGVQSIMNSFKSQDGSLDFNKMMDTAGSMMNAVSQVSSMVKGLGGIIKA